MAEIITDTSQKELKKHGSDEFPLLVSYEKLSEVDFGFAPYFIIVTRGHKDDDICLRYADSFPDTRVRDLLMMGKSGLGKTFLMQCIAHRVAERGYLPTYVSAYRFFETARQAYMDNDGARLRPLMEAELLLIDDLGTEPLMNNVTVTQLFNLLNERQMSGRHTVLSTNLSMNELQERYTERVTSRLLDKGACLRVGFVGGDVRRERRRKGKEA